MRDGNFRRKHTFKIIVLISNSSCLQLVYLVCNGAGFHVYLPHVFEVTFHCRLREKRERQFEQNSFVQGECTCLHIAECRNISQRKLYCNPKDICSQTQNGSYGIPLWEIFLCPVLMSLEANDVKVN